jgi:hypothetical protein
MPEAPRRPTCRCGHDRYHHAIRPDLRYGALAWLRLFSGISGQPREITFRCAACGEAFETTREARILSEFRRYPYVDRQPGT